MKKVLLFLRGLILISILTALTVANIYADTITSSFLVLGYMPAVNVKGHKIYCGMTSKNYTKEFDVVMPNQTLRIEGLLPEGTYYCASKAYTDKLLYSKDYSKELIFKIAANGQLLPQYAFNSRCSGIRFSFSWTEPTKNPDGSPLTDLANTFINYRINGGTPIVKTYAASKPTGGGKKTASITFLIDCEINGLIEIWVTAKNVKGEEIYKSEIVEKKISKTQTI